MKFLTLEISLGGETPRKRTIVANRGRSRDSLGRQIRPCTTQFRGMIIAKWICGTPSV
jgi:hypothetical protein